MRTKTVTLDPDVLDVLRRSEVTACSVRLPEQLDRALYQRVDKALAAAGGKWSRRAGCHVFAVDPRQTLTLDAGSVVHRQQTFQRFDTPDLVADRLVTLANLQPGMRCLEPSVGGGSILRALERAGADEITAIDVDEHAIVALQRETMRYHHRELIHLDFLSWNPPSRRYDRVVMNPPFTNAQDAAHVCHAFDLLTAFGVLVAIIAPTSLRKTTKPFARLQELMRRFGTYEGRLPRGTFADTSMETTIIRLDRRG